MNCGWWYQRVDRVLLMGQVGVSKLTIVYNNIYLSHCIRTIIYILHVYVINKNMYCIQTYLNLTLIIVS